MGDQKRKPRVLVNFFFLFFFLFFPLPFQGDISSIYQLFVPHFAMAIFMCTCLQYCINKQHNMYLEFSLILSMADPSKHLISA